MRPRRRGRFPPPRKFTPSPHGTTYGLYAEENEESGLFLLPYTYYVRVEERGEEFSSVVYGTDEAPYTRRPRLLQDGDAHLRRLYPRTPLLEARSHAHLHGAGDFTQRSTVHYYGTSYLGTQRYFYVLSDGVFDYIPAARDVNYELNTDYLTDVSAPAEELPVEEESSSALSGIEIAALILGILAVAAIAFFVLRGRKAPSAAAEGEEF